MLGLGLSVGIPSKQAGYDHVEKIGLMDKFAGTRVAAPEPMPRGLLITHVWTPAGVLLHFAERDRKRTADRALQADRPSTTDRT